MKFHFSLSAFSSSAAVRLSLLFFCWMPLASKARAFDEVNRLQKTFLESQIRNTVSELIANWKEENFGEGIYELGEANSRRIVSAGDFASEMIAKDWRLDGGVIDNGRIENVTFTSLVTAKVTLRLHFKHVINFENLIEKTVALTAVLEKTPEGKQWRFNLLRIANLPF